MSRAAEPRVPSRFPRRRRRLGRGRLRAARAGHLLAEGVDAWRTEFGTFVGLTALAWAPLWIARLTVFAGDGRSLGRIATGATPASPWRVVLAVAVLLVALAVPMLGARAVAAWRAGRRASIGSCLAAAGGRLPALFVLAGVFFAYAALLLPAVLRAIADATEALHVYGLAFFIAFVAGLFAFGPLAGSLLLAAPACVLECVGPLAALRRAVQLVAGHWLVLGALVLGLWGLLVTSTMVVGGFGAVFSLDLPVALRDGIGALVYSVATAAIASAYLALQARAEHTDVTTFAERVLDEE